jgi:hypothetical protein
MASAKKLLIDALLLPLRVASVFTMEKAFGNPVIGSRLLNVCGLHAFRMILAQIVYHGKQGLLSFLATAEERRLFAAQGYLIKENFLPEEEFAELRRQIVAYDGPARDMVEGDTLTRRLHVTEREIRRFPAFAKLLGNRHFSRLIRYTSARNEIPRAFVECLFHGTQSAGDDPQKDLHKDTFHPTVKAWLYLDDVGPHNGPFVYVPGSHRLTWRRLHWEYRQSVARSSGGRGGRSYSLGGAFRVAAEDAEFLGLPEPVSLPVARNTLVIADTLGFHKRGTGDDGASRMAIFFTSRVNPFNPFPGINNAVLRRVNDWLYTQFLQSADRKAAKCGTRAESTPVHGPLREAEADCPR